MAVDYDLICRRDELGPLLAAAFLAQKGCRVLLLPELFEKAPDPDFLIPVVRGCPARLLASLLPLESPPTRFLSWQDDSTIREWPRSQNQAADFSQLAESNLKPELWFELERLWQLIDCSMEQGLEIPASSLGGIGRVIWLLVRNELLRVRRNCNLLGWLKEGGVSSPEQQLWRSLVPLISLGRFSDPPLLSFAYGIQTLLAPDAWVDITALKERLLKYLLSQGAHQVDEEWAQVFDGKWFIGVGYEDKVARRATLFLADSNPDSLMQEVPRPRRRRDFMRQFQLDEPGFCLLQKSLSKSEALSGRALYHLDCRRADDFTRSLFWGPEGGKSQSRIEHRWQAVNVSEGALSEPVAGKAWRNVWGWQPHLPSMMGGGFLPLSGSFCRFYQLGWHNLPGFGLGGLIYSAHQVAVSALKNELKK